MGTIVRKVNVSAAVNKNGLVVLSIISRTKVDEVEAEVSTVKEILHTQSTA